MNMSERLERMARRADEFGALYSNPAWRSPAHDGPAEQMQDARTALLFTALAQILRAGKDPSDEVRQEQVKLWKR